MFKTNLYDYEDGEMGLRTNYEFCQCNDVNTISDGIEDEDGCWDICEKCGKRISGSFIPYATDDEIKDSSQSM